MEWDALGSGDGLRRSHRARRSRRAQRVFERAGAGCRRRTARPSRTGSSATARRGGCVEMLWEPLAVAALNQADRAGAAPRRSCACWRRCSGRDPRDSALAVPLRPLRRDVRRAGARRSSRRPAARSGVEPGARRRARRRGSRRRVARRRLTPAAAVCAAVPGSRLRRRCSQDRRGAARAADRRRRRHAASPIVTVNLWFDRAVLPARLRRPARPDDPVGLRQAAGLRRRRRRTCRSCRAARRPWCAESNDELIALARADELATALPDAAPRAWSAASVVRERRATFSLAPGQPPRPAAATPVRACSWPATGPTPGCPRPSRARSSAATGRPTIYCPDGHGTTRPPCAIDPPNFEESTTMTTAATTKAYELLGAEAEALLSYEAKGFNKKDLHLPGPDFVDRVVSQTDRSPSVLRNFQTILNPGRLARHRLRLDPPGRPGHRALGGRELRARTRSTSTRRTSSSWRSRAAATPSPRRSACWARSRASTPTRSRSS